MVDPLPVAGAYPIARDLLTLAKQTRKIYKGVHYAKQNLRKMTDRAEIVAGTYGFFRETMKRAKRIKKLSRMFKRNGDLVKKVEDESKRVVDRLKGINDIFWFLRSNNRVHVTDKWIGQYQWYRRSKKIIPGLFQDMEVLESSMRTIGVLVNTHMLIEDYKTNGSEELRAQIKSSQMMLKVEFQKLEYTQHGQEEPLLEHGFSRSRSLEPKSFFQVVSQFLEDETPRLESNEPAPNNPSTIDSRSSSISPASEVASPVTPPSTPPHQSDADQSLDVEPKAEESSMPRKKVQRRRTQSEPPQHISSLSPSPSFLSTVEEVENYEETSEKEIHEQDKYQEKEDTYMQMPPFGPPTLGPRPRAGRTSPDLPSPSGSKHVQQKDSLERQGQSHSTLRRRRGSDISVYGNGGEVTATHLTGDIGLPPETRKGKNR